jgi:hypothetical protein
MKISLLNQYLFLDDFWLIIIPSQSALPIIIIGAMATYKISFLVPRKASSL